MSVEAKHAYRYGYLKSEKWKNVRIEALAREGGCCQICSEESLSNDAHHMWYPENIWDTTHSQLIILCRPCHEFIHVMVPECKTSNEQEGREAWEKYKTAITTWRKDKINLFGTMDKLEMPGVKQLRDTLESHRSKWLQCAKERKRLEEKMGVMVQDRVLEILASMDTPEASFLASLHSDLERVQSKIKDYITKNEQQDSKTP